jgi:hypothetical protein
MTTNAWLPFNVETAYYRFIREERHFCAILTHLLMQGADAVRALLTLVDERLQANQLQPLPTADATAIDEAQIYFEPAFLRDIWSTLGANSAEPLSMRNARRRAFIFELFARVPTLAALEPHQFPESTPAFNASFIGSAGRKIT